MKRILVPCDFSTPAQEAFKFAVKIAQQYNGEIYVLHIIDITFLRGNPSLSHNYAFNLNFLKDMEQEAGEKFKAMWRRYSPMTLPVKFRHSIGSLIPDIENYIREKSIDLVIMGTHGTGGSKLGSNTEKMVRNAPVPVLVIRKSPEKEIKSIVFPVLPDQSNKAFVDEVKNLQTFFNATIHLIWVNTPLIFKADPDSQTELHQFVHDFRLDNYSVNIRADYSVEEGVLRFAKEINADMIAMGTHAWKGLAHSFIGSTAEDIVNHASLPIWTYTMK